MHSAGGRCMFVRLKIELARRTSSMVTMDMKEISLKFEKMAFYVVILTIFQITVIWSILINSDYILRYLDMKVLRFHIDHSPKLSGFFIFLYCCFFIFFYL